MSEIKKESYRKLVEFVQQISGISLNPPCEIMRRIAKELLIGIGEKHWEKMSDEEKYTWGRKRYK